MFPPGSRAVFRGLPGSETYLPVHRYAPAVYTSQTDLCAGLKSNCSRSVRHALAVTSGAGAGCGGGALQWPSAKPWPWREAPRDRAGEGRACALAAGVLWAQSSWYFDLVMAAGKLIFGK